MPALLERPETVKEEDNHEVREIVVNRKNRREPERPKQKAIFQEIFDGHYEFLGCTPD